MRRGEVLEHNTFDNYFERRSRKRFFIEAPILFKNHSERQDVVAAGFTRNVSACGVFVVCEQSVSPQLGNEVAVELLLPPLNEGSGPNLRLAAVGRVARLNSMGEPTGFAVAASFGYEESL